MIGFFVAIIVFAGIIKSIVDITKQLRRDIRRRDEGRKVIEYARLHGISICEANEILNRN